MLLLVSYQIILLSLKIVNFKNQGIIMDINKENIIKELAPFGFTPTCSEPRTALVLNRDIYSFSIDVNMCRYVRTPTKNRTEVKFNSIEELIKKMTKFFNDIAKKEAKIVDEIAKKEERKKEELDKFSVILKYPFFSLKDGEYYYKEHKVQPRLNKEDTIFFRAIISGEIKNFSPAELMALHDFLDEL